MKFEQKDPPRRYTCGADGQIEISDCGEIFLEPDEQVTFVSDTGKQHDVTRKSWGFYATQSMNSRLSNFGWKTALVKNEQNRYFVMIVDQDRLEDFQAYLNQEKNEVVEWLDERN